ncbi:dephospho-CoA kinase [uncultured Polaribacter sp.]|uniref:dephospho-CoA kinase n=1 Tax=uncultured Polaribacter sp. TaxID=174711 RepID=UPI002634A60C|nr:dephospho-CoA kinase [uncultured Polaribacter sp.]
MIVGLTGGIGSGKTTVANFFAEFNNVAIYIADLEAKKLMSTSLEIKEKLINEFGVNSFLNDELNRQYISEIVFKDKTKLSKLNAIVHPAVKRHFKEFVDNNSNKKYIIYENAILFESKSNEICNYIITVTSNLKDRIKRVIDRDSSSKKQVLERVKNQWSDDKKKLQSNYLILNNDLSVTKLQVINIHNILTQKVR